MRMRCGIWARLGRRYGGIGELVDMETTARFTLTASSFLVKDAQEDLHSARLKA